MNDLVKRRTMMNNRTGKTGVLMVFALALLATLAIPSISYASDAESIRKLRQVKRYVESLGVDCRGSASGNYLKRGDYYVVKTTLYRWNHYMIIGAGDSNVRDLDILLLDENYNEIDRDTGTDSTPIVKVQPRWSGTFYIAGLMYSGHGYSNIMICYK
jgi:hypothetical protein